MSDHENAPSLGKITDLREMICPECYATEAERCPRCVELEKAGLAGSRPTAPEPSDREQIIRRYLRWRWGSLAKATKEAREKAEQDFDFFAAALAGPPPAGDPMMPRVMALVGAVLMLCDELDRQNPGFPLFDGKRLRDMALEVRDAWPGAALRGGSPNENADDLAAAHAALQEGGASMALDDVLRKPCRACGERDAGIAPTAVHTCRGGSHQPEGEPNDP